MSALLPVPLYLLAAVEDGLTERRGWRIFRIGVVGVTAQQVWLERERADPLPASRLPRGYLLEAAPWSPTLWVGPDPEALLVAARTSWREQLAAAERHVAALDLVEARP